MRPFSALALSTPLTPTLSSTLTARPHSSRELLLRFDPVKAGWLAAMVIASLVWTPQLMTPGSIAASMLLTFVTVCLGHSVGLHRGVIHRTYRSSRAVQNVLIYLFVLTGLGSPLGWIRLHTLRDQAQNDPNSPDVFGYEHGMLRDFWINLIQSFDLQPAQAERAVPEALRRDRYLVFLSRTWMLHQLPLAVGLWLLGGWGYVASGVCTRVAITILGHWFVGYVAHTSGQRPFRIDGAREEGTNVPILGVLSFGEGWHNNHHAFPDSAQFGFFPGQLDLGFLVLRGLETLGLVRDVQTPMTIAPKIGVRPTTPEAARIVAQRSA